MRFDILAFLQSERIEYKEHGQAHNVARGNVNIACPFCGASEWAHHMGINLQTGAYGCWRNNSHRGKNPTRLVKALKRCSWVEAEAIVKQDTLVTELDVAMQTLTALENKQRPTYGLERQEFPRELRLIQQSTGGGRFWDYLWSRGFDDENDLEALISEYGLRAATAGRWAWRICLPFFVGDTLYGWTGRHIGKKASLRYLSEPKSGAGKRCIFNHNALECGGRALIICEGPFDALKVDFYAQEYGVRAVATLGTSLVKTQMSTLLKYGPRFDSVYIMFDASALHMSLGLCNSLSSMAPRILHLPDGVDDPGDMTYSQVQAMAQRMD